MSMITLRGVSKSFATRRGEVEALRDITLDVGDGEFITLVGRSGCGKSTLLRIVAGLVPATAGEVVVGGEAVQRPRQDVGLMFQRPALLPWRSVLDNVLLPMEIIERNGKRHGDRARELLETVGLSGFADRLPRELSGGMQQRVSLCRSLIHNPQVLLMDEPFAALDALTREELSVELQRICAEANKTVVFVTHSVDEAVILADRVVVLSPRPGRIKEIVDVPVPRPRGLGRSEHTPVLSDASAQLHDLLFDRSEELAS